MSDDDLWRPKEPADGPVDGDDTGIDTGAEAAPTPREQPAEPVSDETQPITGAGPTYVPPPGPSAVPPPQNPYAAPPSQGAPPGPYPARPSPYGQPQHNPYASGFPASGPPPSQAWQQGQPGQPGQSGQPGGPGFVPPANPYAAPHEFAQPQSPYGVPYQPAYAGGQLPDHPSATTAMVLGIIGLVGIVLCGGLTLILSPAAWIVGRKSVREIDSTPGRYAGRDKAQAGKIMGIIGSVLLALGVLAILAFVALAVVVSPGSDSQPPAPVYSNSGA